MLRRLARSLWRGAAPAGQVAPNLVRIAYVADSVTTIETCKREPGRFAPVQTDRERNPFLGWVTAKTRLRAWRLRDVVLDRKHMVLLKDGRVIAETSYLQSPADVAALTPRKERLRRIDSAEIVAPCFDHWDANYYHWTAHTLPTVHAVLQRPEKASLIVPNLHPWQRRTLELLGASDTQLHPTEPDQQYVLPLVDYYDYAAGRADFAISALSRAAYARMNRNRLSSPSPHRLVYVNRKNTINRLVSNESALVARLAERGFHIAQPEERSLDEQIALFEGAHMVVGLLGAGLANIAFCRPGAIVYELVPEHHQNPCFLKMAMQGGLRYWADSFPTGVLHDDHVSASKAPIAVDQVMRRIDELSALA